MIIVGWIMKEIFYEYRSMHDMQVTELIPIPEPRLVHTYVHTRYWYQATMTALHAFNAASA